MTDVSVNKLVKSFEQDKNILDALSFEVLHGEHIGILGKNGAGKTTLFRLLTGELLPDEGGVYVRGGCRVGLLSQLPEYAEEVTVEDVLRHAQRRIFELEARIQELSEKLAQGQDALEEYGEASAEFERLGGYGAEAERNRVANGLDIPAKMREQLFSELSGGERTRVNLARLILEDTDILLLDEPTNHLDLHATEWLEEYLKRFSGTALIVSHDRYFLDVTARRIIELEDGKAFFYSGNYSFYVAEKARRYDEQLKKYEKEQAERERLKQASERLRLWAFLGNDAMFKRAKSMERRREKLGTDRPKKEREMKVKFAERAFSGDEVLVVDGLSKSFGTRRLFSGLELIIEGGERVALLGDNGAGKSTFLSIVMGLEEPDEGLVRMGPSVRAAYLPQIIHFEHPERSVLDTILYEENCSVQQARDRLGSFKFSGEDVFKPVSALSGGERSRLRLCILMRRETNFLLLDEPTNHLDIMSREWLESALDDYEEALLFVSHDRYFIEKFATRLWVLSGGVLWDFRGTYAEYREYCARQEELHVKAPAREKPGKKGERVKKTSPRDAEKRLARLEREIGTLEARLAEIDRLREEFSSDYVKLLELDEEEARLSGELDGLYEAWGEG
jgi:ATPase subunit of ABC transporter with duplicated ATPase domains